MNSSGEMLKLPAPLEHLNLHLREGSILPTQVSSHPPPPWAGDCPRGDTYCTACAPQCLKSWSPVQVAALPALFWAVPTLQCTCV